MQEEIIETTKALDPELEAAVQIETQSAKDKDADLLEVVFHPKDPLEVEGPKVMSKVEAIIQSRLGNRI